MPAGDCSTLARRATVVHACKTIQDRLQIESDLRESVTQIVHKLGRILRLSICM